MPNDLNFLETDMVYGEKFDVKLEPYYGEDFTKKCFLFPGQGVIKEGMLKEFVKNNKNVLSLFTRANEVLKEEGLPEIEDYILNPKKHDAKSLNKIKNLSLFILEIGLFQTLVRNNTFPDVLTGHSFGEYAVLCCSGAFKFEDIIRVIFERDKLSEKYCAEAYFLAVNLNEEQIIEEQIENSFLANINTPQQSTLVFTSLSFLKSAQKKLKKKKVASKRIKNIIYPYHTELMNKVSEGILDHLRSKNVDVHEVKIPFVSSVTKRKYVSISKEDAYLLLSDQVRVSVKFPKQIIPIYESGIKTFYEMGPNRDHLNFVRNIIGKNKNLYTRSFLESFMETGSESENVEKITPENSNLIKVLSQIVSKVSGYEIAEIAPHDRFQEDLGIDSLKKAEVVFEFLKASNLQSIKEVDFGEFSSLSGTINYLNELKNKEEKGIDILNERFFRFSYKFDSYPCSLLKIDPLNFSFVDLSDFEKIKDTVLCFDFRSGNFLIDPYNIDEMVTFLEGIKKLLKHNEKIEKVITLVDDKSSVFFKNITPFFLSLKKEGLAFDYRCIEFKGKEEESLNGLISRVFSFPHIGKYIYDNKKWYRNNLVRAEKDLPGYQTYEKFDSSLWVGGAKGIGASLLKKMMFKNGHKVILVGRSHFEDEEIKNNIREMENKGLVVHYLRFDFSDIESIKNIKHKLEQLNIRPDLAINAAGSEISKNFLEQEIDEIKNGLGSKILTTLNFLKLTDLLETPNKFIFSSIVSSFGNQGQAIYSMANSIVEDLARGDGKASAILWPAWNNVGMTSKKHIQASLKNARITLLEESKASELFSMEIGKISNETITYSTEADLLKYSLPLINVNIYKNLLGVFKEGQFQKKYNSLDFEFLGDHTINGVKVLPAAFSISSFLAMSYLFSGILRGLSNIEIKHMLPLEEDSVDTVFRFGKKLTQQTAIIHSSAEVLPLTLEGNVEKLKDVNKFFNEDEIIETDSIYTKDTLSFGEKFQSINLSKWDNESQTITAKVSGELKFLNEIPMFSLLIKLIDSSFQALCLGGIISYLRLAIPQRIEELVVNPENLEGGEYIIIAKLKKCNDKNVIGNISLFNEKGDLVLLFKNLELVSIREYEVNPLHLKKLQS
jgi:malonyl CoA-acyl carrier protein transacylase